LLRNNFGAEGNGINEMLDGLGDKIPYDLQQSLRYIASVRNKAAHSYTLEIVDTDDFLNQCKSAISFLEVLSTNEFTSFGSPPRGFAPSQQGATSDAREPYELKSDPGGDSWPSRSAGSGSSWDWRDTFEMCWVSCWALIRIVVGLGVAVLPILTFYWIGSGVVSWFRKLDIRPQTQVVSQVQPSAECHAKFTEFTVWAQQWQPLAKQPMNEPAYREGVAKWQPWVAHCTPQWQAAQTAAVMAAMQDLDRKFAEGHAVSGLTADGCQHRMEGFRDAVTAVKMQLSARTVATDRHYATWKETQSRERWWIDACRRRVPGWDLPTSLQADINAIEQRFVALPRGKSSGLQQDGQMTRGGVEGKDTNRQRPRNEPRPSSITSGISLIGMWEAQLPNNAYHMKVSWNEGLQRYEGVLIKNGYLSQSVGFSLGELVWTGTLTDNQSKLIEQQKGRWGVNGVSTGFQWSNGTINLDSSSSNELVTSTARFRRIQ
jgi:hypothetical protein